MDLINVINELKNRKPDGQITVKGMCHDDVVSILLSNGYEIIEYADAYGDGKRYPSLNERTFHIAFWKSDFNKLLEQVEGA